jgi:hypothetical protein
MPVLAIFSPAFISIALCDSLLAVCVHGGFYAIATWLPTFLHTERHLTILSTGSYLAVIIVSLFRDYVARVYCNDGVERLSAFVLFVLGLLAVVIGDTQLPISNEKIWCLALH